MASPSAFVAGSLSKGELPSDASSTDIPSGSSTPLSTGASLPTWQPIPALLGVKSKKRLVLRLGLAACEDTWGLSLSTRAALTGLSHSEQSALLQGFRRGKEEGFADGWTLQLQEGLKIACIAAGKGVEAEIEAAVASVPHLVVVEAEALRRERLLWCALAGFGGAVLVLDTQRGDMSDERELCAVGITTRWHRQHNAKTKIVSEPLQAWLHDIELDPSGNCSEDCNVPGLDMLVLEQLGPLYDEDFSANLENLGQAQHDYGLKLSLLVEPTAAASPPELLGFVIYKPWAAPRPGVSCAAVGVAEKHRGRGLGRKLMAVAETAAAALAGRVYLLSLPTAVPFYMRLGYYPMLVETGNYPSPTTLSALAPKLYKDGEIDEDSPCVPMMSHCIDARGPATLPAEPWSPRRARHLEDGPTWMPIGNLIRG